MQKLKKGDEVIVLTGKDKGERGKIIKVIVPAHIDKRGKNIKKVGAKKLLVEGINSVKKHQKGNPNTGVKGGIIDKYMPIDISNVGLYNPETKKVGRVGFKFLEEGKKKKVRYFKATDKVVDA